MAQWNPLEILHAENETAGALPSCVWIPVALADICRGVLAWGGAKVSRGEVLASWGFDVDSSDGKREMSDEELIGMGNPCP